MTGTSLLDLHCRPRKNEPALDRARIEPLLQQLHADWSLSDDVKRISRTFRFKDYYHTMAFVNALAWIAHREDHHPDLEVGYNRCVVHFSTHSVGGLSENDFICAARVDALLDDAE